MIRRPLVIPQPMRRIPRTHLEQIEDRIPLRPSEPVALPATLRFLFLCFTNRSGSAHLGDLLHSTGYFEWAPESLNAGEVLQLCSERGITSFVEYFAHVAQREARNNIYIVKVVPEQIILLIQSGILDQIVERSDFLFLNRVDKLAQAISTAIAQQNNRWAWDSPIELPDDRLVYSRETIAERVNHVTILNLCFERFFIFNGIAPITVEYERIIDRPQDEVARIARRLRLPPLRADTGKLRYQRQANEVNEAWRARFLQEGELPPDTSQWAWTPADDTVPASVQPAARSAGVVEAEIVVHVRNAGDVAGGCGEWIGRPNTGLWIEAFSITPRQGVAREDIEYQGYQDFGRPLPWVSGGELCGTRGKMVPLRGLCVRLRGAAAGSFRCSYSARFQDGTTVGPVEDGQMCRSTRLAPLEAIHVEIQPRAHQSE
jgi:LPS sulfotransferase NodH